MASPATSVERTAARPEEPDNVLEIEGLHVEFTTPLGVVRAVNGVDLAVPRGRVLGIVGESGCGKSITALATMQLVPHPGRIVAGRILIRPAGGEPIDVLRLDRHSPQMRSIRGNVISMIFQEPMTSLNPCYTVGDQIMEAILLHQTRNEPRARAQAIEVLRKVGMPNPRRIFGSYPHELSGGMRQRAMVALALSCTPDVLLADEPTTALDVTTQAQILDVMRDLQQEIGMSIVFVTHNLGVVAQMCDEVAVMYLGKVVERGTVDEIFYDPKHPYTISLLRSIPHLGLHRKERLEVIKGSVPDPYTAVSGCPFHPRCPSFMPGICDTLVPAETSIAGAPQHTVRCHLYPGSTVGAAPGTSGVLPESAPAA
jgi:peptide/nickel transport system ATP-binding protein